MIKTFDRKDVFSWSNADEAEKYVGKSGYFSDCCCDDLQDWSYGELTQIHPDCDITEIFANDNRCSYGLFIPEDQIKKEMEYRPFKNQDEIRKYFNRATTLCCPLHLEHKRTAEKFTLMVTGFFDNGLVLPLYGALTCEQLFDMFILYRDGKQKPFGVLEE